MLRAGALGQPGGSVIVTDAALVNVSALAQWISRRIWSKATRALSWAWKRRLASSSAFAPRTKSVVSAVTTTRKMVRTASSSTSV